MLLCPVAKNSPNGFSCIPFLKEQFMYQIAQFIEANYSIIRSITTYSGEFLMSPWNDFAFRLLFGDPNNADILLDLLNAILPDHFESVVCTNPHLLIPDTKKECILDITALSDSGVHVDIEMQVLNLKSMEK